MKKLSVRILCCLMALLLIVGLTACGGEKKPAESDNPAESESNEPIDSEDEDSEGEDSEGEDSDDNTDTSSKTDSEKTSANSGTTTKKTKGARTTAVKHTQSAKTTSLTWKQVKATIPSSAKGKTIELYEWNPKSEVEQHKTIVNAFTAETGIKVKWTTETYATYTSKLTARVAAKNSPDIARLQNPSLNWVTNLQPLENSDYNFNDTYWDQTVLKAYTFNGHLYGANVTNSPIYCPEVVFYNKKLIKSDGLEDPYTLWKAGKWTWDKLWDMCKEFKDLHNDTYKCYNPLGGEYFASVGAMPVTRDSKGQFKNSMTDAKFQKAFEVLADKWDKGYVSWEPCDTEGFNGGKILFCANMGMAARTGHSYFQKLRHAGNVGVVPMPSVKGQSTYYMPLGEVQAYGIVKGASNLTIAPYFLRYFLDPDNYDMSTFYEADHAAEVMAWCAKQKNPVIGYTTFFQNETTGRWSEVLYNLMANGKENVKSVIDSISPRLDSVLSDANKTIKKL